MMNYFSADVTRPAWTTPAPTWFSTLAMGVRATSTGSTTTTAPPCDTEPAGNVSQSQSRKTNSRWRSVARTTPGSDGSKLEVGAVFLFSKRSLQISDFQSVQSWQEFTRWRGRWLINLCWMTKLKICHKITAATRESAFKWIMTAFFFTLTTS